MRVVLYRTYRNCYSKTIIKCLYKAIIFIQALNLYKTFLLLNIINQYLIKENTAIP
jgi:hypothetical protein